MKPTSAIPPVDQYPDVAAGIAARAGQIVIGFAIVAAILFLAAGIAAMALIVVRTVFEDRLLQAELPGYRDYAREVRYRLVPGIW